MRANFPMKNAAAAGTIRLGDLTVNQLRFGAMRLCGPSRIKEIAPRHHISTMRVGACMVAGPLAGNAADTGTESVEHLQDNVRAQHDACARKPQRFGVKPALQ